MWWRRQRRGFEVLGQRFELPTLRLGPRLERAARLRRRLGATWLEALLDPVARPLRKGPSRVMTAFGRAHRVLSAHEEIVLAALDHVAVYDDALGRATTHVTERARHKIDQLLARAAERQRVAERAAHLAERVRPELERDLDLIAQRIKAVARAAHLMLVRLGRYRGFVRQTLGALVRREAELADQRTLLVHDEHRWHIDRELSGDVELRRWVEEPDRLCAGIEASLRQMVGDLDGLESGLAAVPERVEVLLSRAEAAEPGEGAMIELVELERGLPALAEVPVRLDDEDFDAVLEHEHDGELVFGARTVEALGVEVEEWLASVSGEGKRPARRCATCPAPIISGATLGRAHVLCAGCRERARRGGHAWLREVGFEPRRGEMGFEVGPITRVVFESVMGWVPAPGPARQPVTDVSWHEAIAFCNALSEREGRAPAYRVGAGRTKLAGGVNGWRLPERAGGGGLREWLWAGVEEGPAPRRLGPGLRRIGGAGEVAERRVPEARDPDLGFRVVAPVHAPEPERVRAPEPARGRLLEPARPPVVRPATRPAGPSQVGRRVGQAMALTALVGVATALVIEEVAPSTPLSASDTRTAQEPSATTAAATSATTPEAPEEPTTAAPPASPAAADLERGYSARAKKDRKSARAHFEAALEQQPGDLTARYEAAREAAYARDTTAAFAHLDALVTRAEEVKARALLGDALNEPDFARLTRDGRWKKVQRAARP